MALRWPQHSPLEVLDYYVDWTNFLTTGDSLLTSVTLAPIPAGTVIGAQAIVGNNLVSQIFISGGTPGLDAKFHVQVTTSFGRTIEQTVFMAIGQN